MKRLLPLVLLSLVLVATPACYTFKHTVGNGPTSGMKSQEDQWFILWGLVPLNSVDSKALVGSASNYRVTTQFTPLDVIISAFTGWITIHKQTIVVEK